MGVDSTNVYNIFLVIISELGSIYLLNSLSKITIRNDHRIMYIINVVDFIFQHLEALNS